MTEAASFVIWVGRFSYYNVGTGVFTTDAIVPVNYQGADLCEVEGSRRRLSPGDFNCDGCDDVQHYDWDITRMDFNSRYSDISAAVEGRLIIKLNEGEGDPQWDDYIVTDEGGNLHNGCMRLDRGSGDYETCVSARGLDSLEAVPHLTCYTRNYEGWTTGVVFG